MRIERTFLQRTTRSMAQRQLWIAMMCLGLLVNGCVHHGKGHGESSYGSAHGGMTMEGHHNFSQSMEEELMLTDPQKDAFDRIEREYQKMVIRKTADTRAAEVDLAALLGTPTLDRNAIEQKVQAIGTIKEELMMGRIDSLLQLRALLTEEQYEKFRAILEKRMTEVVGHSPH